jgi:hypothetical protein
MTRPGWLARTTLVCGLLMAAGMLAWISQSLLAQSPQQRRILPRRPFRQPRSTDPKDQDPNAKSEPNETPEGENKPTEADDEKKGSGNSLSIVERPSKPSDLADSGADKEREPLFVGWKDPKVVFLLSGNQMGYIEPCGCAGLENQKGGLTRRFTLLNELRTEKGWEVIPLDIGQNSSESRSDRQQELKLQMTSSGLSKMGYQAVGLGPSDVALSTSELAGVVANLPVVSANVSVFEREIGLVPAYRVFKAGDMKIGVTQVVSDSALKGIVGGEIEKIAIAKALPQTIQKLRTEKCDFLILMVYALPEEAEELATKYPIFNLVVHGGLHGDPEREIKRMAPAKAGGLANYVANVGYKGMHVTAVGLFDDPKNPIKYQRVPLDARFSDSHDGLQLLKDYQEELKRIGLSGLGLEPRPYPGGREFVGSETCGGCHTKAYEKWKETPHAHATETIVNPKERAGIARHHDPECLSCHVTGWSPQGYYPYTTGYLDLKKSALLQGNGCENCHGPGAKHVAAEEAGGSDVDLAKLRESMRLPLASAKKKCLECHDLDNSPDFQKEGAFESYWEEVKHPWRD